jgi:hypothetical protein
MTKSYDDNCIDSKYQLCSITSDNTILSNESHEYPVKFYTGSFALRYTGDILTIELNQMFLWRLLFSMKTFIDNEIEFDFHRMKLYILQMGDTIILQFKKNGICYKFNDRFITKYNTNIFNSIYECYNRLRVLIELDRDLTERVKELFDRLIVILRYISN